MSSTNSTQLPPLDEVAVNKDDSLARLLATLFEGSPILYSTLVPAVAAHTIDAPPTSYSAWVERSLEVIASWPDDLKAQFIAGHPRIGEVKGLSALSAQEQARAATPPEVLARLAHLNACYEHRYPGLRYITFVNGRTRAQIKDEMEDKLGLAPSLDAEKPAVEDVGTVEVGGEEWKGELERAVRDVGRIAQARLASMGVA